LAKLVRTPHQIQAMPLGGVNWRDNCAITGALSYALRNAKMRGIHCLPGEAAIKSSRKINKSSACRDSAGKALSWTISKSINRARFLFSS
jgi:hypothetical protein